jgi:hypothetical protein
MPAYLVPRVSSCTLVPANVCCCMGTSIDPGDQVDLPRSRGLIKRGKDGSRGGATAADSLGICNGY